MNAREWFSKAQSGGWAIGAFNVDNLDIFKAICVAAQNKKSPAIVEFSPGEVGYFGLKNIVDLVNNAREEYKIPILLNLDHAKKVEDCLAAIEIGSPSASSGPATFDEVHFDGSDLDFNENVEVTKKVVGAAHANPTSSRLRGAGEILVEGEIDKVSGSSEVHSEEVNLEVLKSSYTDPDQAAKFVAETQVDIFAVVFGNVHGTFPVQPDLDIELLKKIRQAIPNTFISLHGGSGIPAEQVQEAIRVGKIVKVNVNTELRQAFRDALAEKLAENPDEYTYYKIVPDVVMAIAAVVEAKIDVFGSANRI